MRFDELISKSKRAQLVTDWSRVLIGSTVENEGDRIYLEVLEPRQLGEWLMLGVRTGNRL